MKSNIPKIEHVQPEYIQQDMDVTGILQMACDTCMKPLKDFYEENRMGHIEVYGNYEINGDLIGFLCPDCAHLLYENRTNIA